ncbi:MAG TPA: GNAT family N-acetyltransferase [Blastocatellia bacterium]|nr:GNAT family N-acetyltransferase [Blastocatellia bacterium]
MKSKTSIRISALKSIPELRAVEELQKEAWEMGDRDLVPVAHLAAVKEAGGILIGAYDGGTLAGFAYGFMGMEEGRVTFHSHLLAVKPAYRNQDLGRQLKLEQRERALAKGITLMTWTFDPLQSRNAHLNLGKLGVVSEKYLIDFYGEASSSFLHRTGTDRLWVSWWLDSERVRRRIEGGAAESPLPELPEPLVEMSDEDSPLRNDRVLIERPPRVAIRIPADLVALQQRDPALAVSWRESTRWAFTEALAAGYLVEEFYRGGRYGIYLLRSLD